MTNDVILRSRVRIARNIKDYPFPPTLNEVCRKEIIDKAAHALDNLGYIREERIKDEVFALALSEENIISREFANEKEAHALLKNERAGTYIMVCEEDHLRIQSFADGLNIKEAGKHALECERMLNEKITFAFDQELGYLTRCPTNLGTAMRASAMMFLPALTLSHRMGDVKTQLEKIGMTIRGMYGEGSSADAYMYQISNRLSLGQNEDELLTKTEAIAKRLADDEKSARNTLFSANKDTLTDKIMRSVGILKYAHIMQSKEFLDCYAFARLGISLGICNLDEKKLDELLYTAMPAHIMLAYPNCENAAERDKLRAKAVKESLKGDDF